MPRPLYAIGDVHGDADRLINIMQNHGLIDISSSSVRWTKPNVIVVLMGDVLDAKSRLGAFGDMLFENTLSDLWIMEFLRTAAEGAARLGSKLMVILGNHELMNIRGEHQYVSPHHMLAQDAPRKRSEYFSNGKGRATLETLYHTSITYNQTNYSHAGIPVDLTQSQSKMLGKRAGSALLDRADDPQLVELVSHRDYMLAQSGRPTDEKVAEVCRRHQVRRMVIGHNCTDGAGVLTSFAGRVVYTDTGISRAFTPQSTPKTMEIVYDPGDGDLCVLRADGSRAPIPNV